MSTRTRVAVLIITLVLLSVAAIGYVVSRRSDNAAAAAIGGLDLSRSGTLVVRDLRAGPSYNHLAQLRVDDPADRVDSGNVCVRVYAVRGHGVCLQPSMGAAGSFEVAFLDSAARVTASFPLPGIPSRTRISPDGRLFAWTVFVQGDSYNGGKFSTRAGTFDSRTDELINTLEDWHIINVDRVVDLLVGGEKPYRAADINFWGITFSNDDRTFYATMSTAGKRYLVKGERETRKITTIRENVECPSLSPDETRVAFKKRIGKDWRFAVLDLTSGKETLLAETRSVDDQLAWLDDDTLLYGVRRGPRQADIWSVPADGSGTPTLVVPDADSPAFIR